MRRTILFFTALVIAGSASAGAQGGGIPAQPPTDPFAKFLFPPELVMQHQTEIGITDAQRATLTTALQQAQSKFVETQFKLSAEGEKFAKLLSGSTIDETLALEQVDRVLSMEREIKRAQVGLLVRIKNTLTPAQQAKLTQLRQ